MFYRIIWLKEYCKQLISEYNLSDFMFHTLIKGTDNQRNSLYFIFYIFILTNILHFSLIILTINKRRKMILIDNKRKI